MADQTLPKSPPITNDMCLTKVNFRKCTYLWAIDNFISVHDKRKRLPKSLPFRASDDEFKWQLRLNYNPDFNNQSISLNLYPDISNADFTEHSPITGKLKFSIINAENEETCTKDIEFSLVHRTGPLFTGFNSFVTKKTLINEGNKLLPQDRLTIFCELSYIKETDIVNISVDPFSKSHKKREPASLDDVEALFMNEEFSDVMLSVKGKKYPAHKSILVARSPLFKATFSVDMMEKQSNSIEIQDMEVSAFEEMLYYIYAGKVRNLEKLTPELLAAADKFDLKNLKAICEKELYEKLSLETAVSTLMLADMYHADDLKKQALLFIKVHSYSSNILDENVRKSLIQSFPHLLLEIIDTLGK